MLLRILVFVFFTASVFAARTEPDLNTSKALGSTDVGDQLEGLKAKKASLLKSQNMVGQLNEIRASQDNHFSRIARKVFQTVDKGPSKVQIKSLNDFLGEAGKFRNKDGRLSIRTLKTLLKANPKFKGVAKLSPDSFNRLVSTIRDYDGLSTKEIKLQAKVNELRTKVGLKKMKAYKPQIVKDIVTNDVQFLKRDAVREKAEITKDLLKKKTFANKNEIKAAVKADDPRVKRLSQLDRRIQHLDQKIKALPENQLKYKASKVKETVVDTVKQTKLAQKGISYLNKVPASEGMLNSLKAQRIELYKQLKAEGNYENWRSVRKAMADLKVNDPKIQQLRNLDLSIQKARYDLKMAKLPGIESSSFNNRWQNLNKEIVELREVKDYAMKNKLDKSSIKDIRLLQKRAYLQQADLRLRHELIADGTFKSNRGLNEVLKGDSSPDPRVRSLQKIAKAQANLKPQINRSLSGRVGALKRSMRENSFGNKVKKAGSEVVQKGKAMAAETSKVVSQKVSQAGKAIGQKAKVSWNYTEKVAKNGVETIKGKSSAGLEFVKTKTKSGWEISKVKTKEGWEWSRARSKDAVGWAKGTADKGWKYVGDKGKALKAFTKESAQKASADMVEKIRAGKNAGKAKVKAGWEYTKGKTVDGAKYVKAKSVDGWEYAKVKTAKGWDYTRIKTSEGWEWSRARTQDLKGYAKGKADSGWKFMGDKAKSIKGLAVSKTADAKNFTIEKAHSIANKAQNAVAKGKGAWEYTKDMGKKGVKTVTAKSADGWEYTKSKVGKGMEITRIKTNEGWEWVKGRTADAKNWTKGKADAGWKLVENKGKQVKDLSKLAGDKVKGTKDLVIEKVRAGGKATGNAVKKGWEYTNKTSQKGIKTIHAKSVDGWEYAKMKTAKGWEITKVKTGDGWEWTKGRASDAKGWAKGKADAGWKFVGDKGKSLKEIVSNSTGKAKNFTIEKARAIHESTVKAAQSSKDYILGKAKGSWELTKNITKSGKETVVGKSKDGWEFMKNKTSKGWKIARVKTADGWEWTKARSGDAKGWMKGQADKGWKFIGDKTKAASNSIREGYQVRKDNLTNSLKGKIAKLNSDITLLKKSGANSKSIQKRTALRDALQKEINRATGKPASAKSSAKSGSANSRPFWQKAPGQKTWFDPIQNAGNAAGRTIAKGVSNGANWLKGKSIDAFNVTKAKTVQLANKGTVLAKNTGNYVAGRIRMGQQMAGHTWINQGNSSVQLASNGGNASANGPPSAKVQATKAMSPGNSLAAAGNTISRGTLLGKVGSFLSGGSSNAAPKPANPGSSAGTAKPNPGSGASSGKAGGFWGSEPVQNGLKPMKGLGESINKAWQSAKGKGPIEVIKTGFKAAGGAADKFLPSKADPNTGRDGWQVRRDNVANALKSKIDLLNQDIAKMRGSGASEKAIQKRVSLRESLQTEYNKSQISQQGINLQNQITNLDASIKNATKAGAPKAEIDALKAAKTKAQTDLKQLKGNQSAISKNYVKDGLRFAMISAAAQGLMNIVDQVRSGEDVNVGNAFNFVTTPQFMLGTSGAFAGGIVVQKLMTTGMGKIMLASVQNMLPGFIKPIAQILPYTLGAMIGSDLLTGQLGERSVGAMVTNGIGSSVGMMLGSAIFPPIGSIAGAMIGGMIADNIHEKFFGGGGDDVEAEVRMLYEPSWLEFTELAYSSEEQRQVAEVMEEEPVEDDASLAERMDSLVNSITSVDELEAAKKQAYEKYTKAVEESGADHHTARNAYKLYKKVSEKLAIERFNVESQE